MTPPRKTTHPASSPLPPLRPRPVSAGEAAHRALERDWAKRMKMFKKLVARDPDDLSNDDVHDLRVTTRRLRASLWVLRHCGESSVADRTHRDLRALGKVLGERRMWDIAERDAATYRADITATAKKRKRAHAKLRRALRGASVPRIEKELRKLERTIPGLMLERLVPWLQGYEWELAYRLQLSPKTPAERHELRIQAKKVRYVLECLGHNVPMLEKLQDHLGREHDLVVLRDLIGAKRALVRDQRTVRTGADRVMPAALRSAIKQLRALQKEIRR